MLYSAFISTKKCWLLKLMEIPHRVNLNVREMLYINIMGNILIVPAVRKKLLLFSKRGNVLGEFPQSSGTSKHFSLENQSLLYAFLPFFCSAYQLCWLNDMYISCNALISKPSSGLHCEKKMITSTELLLGKILTSAVWLLQSECYPHVCVNGIFLIKTCLIRTLYTVQ